MGGKSPNFFPFAVQPISEGSEGWVRGLTANGLSEVPGPTVLYQINAFHTNAALLYFHLYEMPGRHDDPSAVISEPIAGDIPKISIPLQQNQLFQIDMSNNPLPFSQACYWSFQTTPGVYTANLGTSIGFVSFLHEWQGPITP